MKTLHEVQFAGSGGDQLSGRLDLPADGDPIACAIFAHCFTCSKNLNVAVNIARALTQRGIATLRFDFTGLGGSEGDFADSSFSSNVGDLVSAAEFLEREWEAPAILIGHSLGGSATLCAAKHIPSAKAVVSIGAPFDPWHAVGLLAEGREQIETSGEATVRIGERPFRVRKQLIDDLREQKLDASLRQLNAALLVMHSPVDQTVGIDNAARIYTAARHPKSFVSLDGADHLLSDSRDACYAGDVIASWVSRYLPAREPSTMDQLRTTARVVTRTGDNFLTDIMADHHGLIADEPTAVGGTDLGPTPYDLLMAGLGACTGMTLRMYADRKKWPLDEVRVHLRHDRIHAEDRDCCEDDADARMDRIRRVVEIRGDGLDEEQRARLLEIADRCPVHRTLEAGVRIETEAGEDGG